MISLHFFIFQFTVFELPKRAILSITCVRICPVRENILVMINRPAGIIRDLKPENHDGDGNENVVKQNVNENDNGCARANNFGQISVPSSAKQQRAWNDHIRRPLGNVDSDGQIFLLLFGTEQRFFAFSWRQFFTPIPKQNESKKLRD